MRRLVAAVLGPGVAVPGPADALKPSDTLTAYAAGSNAFGRAGAIRQMREDRRGTVPRPTGDDATAWACWNSPSADWGRVSGCSCRR